MDVVTGIAVGGVTLVVVVVVLLAAGFAVLFRRRQARFSTSRTSPPLSSTPRGDTSIGALGRTAGSLLVGLDDAIRDGDAEVGYASAQFGPDRAQPYADAVAAARAKLTEAFRLKQLLDDATADSAQHQRQWTQQIIALCEQAAATLKSQDESFSALRAVEANASGTLTEIRVRIASTAARLDAATAALASLASTYVPSAYAPMVHHPRDAEKLLAEATTAVDAAAPTISQGGVNDVSEVLRQAGLAVQQASQLLDAVDRVGHDLVAAEQALTAMRGKTTADLVEAKTQRDAAPDADTGAAIIAAIAGVERALAHRPAGPSDPMAELDHLGDAVNALDLALASARNQTERLSHARAAYAGTLVSVTSQIATARDYIGQHGAGVDARTRLAEAERQLTIAQAEVDPVEALDAVRRAVTLARDSDALARYDSMGSR